MADHGNTPAAWTGVVIGLLGFVVGGVGVILSPINMVLFWAGVAIVVLGGVVYFAMDKVMSRSQH